MTPNRTLTIDTQSEPGAWARALRGSGDAQCKRHLAGTKPRGDRS